MITEINNKIAEVCDTVVPTVYQTVSNNLEKDYCIFYYIGDDSTGGDTKSGFEDITIQIDAYAKLNLESEQIIRDIETAIENNILSTTNYKLISKQKLNRVPFAPDKETGLKRLGTQYNLLYERL